jgi:hypothetical protein
MPATHPLTVLRDPVTRHVRARSRAGTAALALWMAFGALACGSGTAVSLGPDAAIPDAAIDQAVPGADVAVGGDSTAPPDGAMAADAPVLPAQCQVTTTRQPPFQVSFRLVNRSSRTVYLSQSCVGVSFDVSSCASRYTASLGPSYFCGCSCSDSRCTGPAACGPCPPPAALPVGAGQTLDLPWQAVLSTMRDRGTFQCLEQKPLPAAVYSVSVPVYDSPTLALSSARPPRTASRTFTLPATGDQVEVVLASETDGGLPPPPACETVAAAPTCAAPWDPAAACSLASAFTFEWSGGFSLSSDHSALTLPNIYTRTRTFREPNRTPLTCTNNVPRCGAAPEVFTTADVVQAMSAPDVLAALAQPTPLVYGFDSRTTDGAVLVVSRADGHGFVVGAGTCGPGNPCERPVPPGLDWLATILSRLDQQQRYAPGCEALAQ